ncbi:hypothetical protein FRACYDRAFT_238831 [Fragilariopsis cylindrus CCMP1102]|uniref:Uncharacterized protein n=1 Tax=Fragilariopsis cylindrus CCMP1102 TaxID=635003 RepID=A0A1E7FEM4_9STRA|nr:hypothetical protein FRACYDRAFT_238831 [Fragilariopsis cylindrus CCMP1102]|eukprot:OEU16243.1 hypothetical protein FRACYDRAFT_238831 [Fragilariopsis cylindrus CCMP1102]
MATSREKKGVIPMESHHDQLFSADNKRTRNVNTVWKSPFEFSSSSAGPGPTKKTKVKNNDGTTTTTRNTKKKSNGRPPRRDSSGTGKTKSSTSSSNVTEGTRSSSIISMKQNNNKNRKTKKKSKKRNNNNKQMEEDMPITKDSLLESTFTTSTTPPSPMTDWDNSVSVSGDGDDSYLVDLEGGGENDSPPLKNGKPRSAYDKDAEWYCGSDSDSNMMDSIRSDGSSVLSLFRKPKEKNKTTMMDMGNELSITDLFSINNDQDGLSEPSMDLSILLGKDEESGNNIDGEVSITISHNNNNDNSNNNSNVIPAMQSESLQIVPMNELLADIENDDDDENSSWSNSNSTNENGVSLLVDDDDGNNIRNDDIFSFDTFNPEEEEGKNNEQESPTFLEKITSKNSVRSAFVVLGLTGVVDIILLGLFLTH